MAIPTDPWVTARANAPVPIKVGDDTRAILQASGSLMLLNGFFPQNFHLITPKISAHIPIRTSHPYPAIKGSRLRATSDIWINDMLESAVPRVIRSIPMWVRSSRCESFTFFLARAIPPMVMGIIQMISIGRGISPNQSQLPINTSRTLKILLSVVCIPSGKNFKAQSDMDKLNAPVSPASNNLGRYWGRIWKLLGSARSSRGDIEIINDKFLTVAIDSPSCLRTWWVISVPYTEYPSIARVARRKKFIFSRF